MGRDAGEDAGGWVPDPLGSPFEQLTLDLGIDGQHGPLAATVVRSIPSWIGTVGRPLNDVDVLYVHGWSDFFFQTELAAFWNRLGARFYALDLRRYGRSLRPDQVPGYVDSLDDYDVDIDAALTAIGHGGSERPRRRLFLLGHSTGGLTLTLWAARHRGRAAALILNSPWLELQIGHVGRDALTPLIDLRARRDPRGTLPELDYGYYTRAQAEIGSLPQDPAFASWRPERGFTPRPGWLAAVLAGHRTVWEGVDVGCPALVLLSTRSSSPMAWSDEMTSTDSVLAVEDIARAATRIGSVVTIARIEGAIHDVFLSRPDPRARAYDVLAEWAVHGARVA